MIYHTNLSNGINMAIQPLLKSSERSSKFYPRFKQLQKCELLMVNISTYEQQLR
jgi:hypothetical protein